MRQLNELELHKPCGGITSVTMTGNEINITMTETSDLFHIHFSDGCSSPCRIFHGDGTYDRRNDYDPISNYFWPTPDPVVISSFMSNGIANFKLTRP